jgi:hypothetical protein
MFFSLLAVGLALAACGGEAGGGGGDVSGCRSAQPSELDEFGDRFRVTSSLSPLPAVGETATLTARIEADEAYSRARLVVELPPWMEFAGSVPGLAVSRGLSFDGQATVAQASGTRDLEPGEPAELRAAVRPTASGSGQVRVRVNAAVSGGTVAGSAEIFLTVGPSAAESSCRIDVPAQPGVTTAGG